MAVPTVQEAAAGHSQATQPVDFARGAGGAPQALQTGAHPPTPGGSKSELFAFNLNPHPPPMHPSLSVVPWGYGEERGGLRSLQEILEDGINISWYRIYHTNYDDGDDVDGDDVDDDDDDDDDYDDDDSVSTE